AAWPAWRAPRRTGGGGWWSWRGKTAPRGRPGPGPPGPLWPGTGPGTPPPARSRGGPRGCPGAGLFAGCLAVHLGLIGRLQPGGSIARAVVAVKPGQRLPGGGAVLVGVDVHQGAVQVEEIVLIGQRLHEKDLLS